MTLRTSPITGFEYPAFFDPFLDKPEAAGRLWMTREMEVAQQARAFRKANGIKPANSDPTELGGTAVVVRVDQQTGFCAPPTPENVPGLWFPNGGGTLYVPGADLDTFRSAKFLLDNLPFINQIADSLDTHRVWQIFHPDMWRGESGAPPDPFTAIVFDPAKGALVNVVTGEAYTCLFNQQLAVRYCQQLAAQGSPPLTIWPYHTRLGSTHHPLMPLASEIQMFHELVRFSEADTEIKGYQQMTESYGIVGDEVDEVGGVVLGEKVRKPFIDLLLKHKAVVILGEASSHCVLATLNQIIDQFSKRDPALVSRIHVLTDCMSPVPAIPGTETDPDSPLNFPAVAAKGLKAAEAKGVKLVKSTDDFLKAALAA